LEKKNQKIVILTSEDIIDVKKIALTGRICTALKQLSIDSFTGLLL
jgi:hypothetical protein